MTQHLHPLKTHSNLKLKEIILIILAENNSVLTLDELLIGLKGYKTTYEINKSKIRRLVNKLAKQGIIEYVYIDLSYGIRLVNSRDDSTNVEVIT
ncbi:MAG: hypothetical protein ACW99A_12580 [Candidatus Kariarchaeaceae archaeon]|jgi:hypothetical protein